MSIRRYLRSPSTLLAAAIGMVMYAAYGVALSAWDNAGLIGASLFVALFLPTYSRLSNKAEEKVNLRFALVTAGRLARFALQLVFNLAIFAIFVVAGLVEPQALAPLGGVVGVALLTTLASQGAQYVGIVLFNRQIGDLNRNVLIALSANIVVTALAVSGVPEARVAFLAAGIVFGGLVFGIGLASDLRGLRPAKGGVGIFFGTFNPFHATHLAIVRDAIARRGLDKVIIHPTVVPKLHQRAFDRGEIRVARVDGGLAIYERTEKADSNVNYFPTGNRFYPPETRRLIIEQAVAEAGLGDQVEVLWLPETYAETGFYGVIAEIRRRNPGARLHGLHGSDLGGMWCRAIYDESGWIYPYPVRRRDGVSATAIRNGAAGMTSPVVTEILAALRSGRPFFTLNGQEFRNVDGRITPVEHLAAAAE